MSVVVRVGTCERMNDERAHQAGGCGMPKLRFAPVPCRRAQELSLCGCEERCLQHTRRSCKRRVGTTGGEIERTIKLIADNLSFHDCVNDSLAWCIASSS